MFVWERMALSHGIIWSKIFSKAGRGCCFFPGYFHYVKTNQGLLLFFSYIPQIVVFFGTLLENIVSSVLDGHKKRRRSIRKH